MSVKLFFVRPKPEVTFQDMPVFLIAAHDEKECWELCYKDCNESKEDFQDYYISESFNVTTPLVAKVIWGSFCTKDKF